MSSSRSSRSKRNESASTTRVKLLAKEMNGTDDDTEEDAIEIRSEDSEDDSSSANEKGKKKLDSSLSKSGFSMTTEMKKLLERVLCCSCGKQLNPMNHGAVRRHPWLKVVTCKKCYKFLRSGPFTRDDDGVDEQCRWCGDGGRLYGCDYCHNCFCRSCIKRNLGRSEASMMESEDDSKWHCYLCKPKKLKKLTDDCDKILGYIQAQEKKEKEREEREKAKQKEKEKREKMKKEEKKEESKDEKEKDLKDEKGTPKRGLPAPKVKSEITEKLKVEKKDEKPKVEKKDESSSEKDKEKKIETSKAVSNSKPDIIVVGDSPAINPHHRAVNYKPDIRTGVQHVQKISDNVTAVTVGPKFDKPVLMPNINKGGNFQRQIQPRPMLINMLTSGASGSNFNQGNSLNTLKKFVPLNDMRALKNNIFPNNVENIAEKLGPMTQSLNLTLNSLKTDLAIAKLSQANMYQAKQMAATQMKNGLEYFFNSLRELLNVQILAKNPNEVADDKSQGDINIKPVSSFSLTSTPNGKTDILVNKINESLIPIEIDASPVKKVEKVEKMETDDVYVVTDNDTKDVKVLHVSNDKVVKEEALNHSEMSVDKNDEIVLDDDTISESDSKNDQTKPLDEDKDLNGKEEPENKTDSKTSEKVESSKKPSKNKTVDDVQEISDNEADEKTSKKSNSMLGMSENSAAELELLKEMADESEEETPKKSKSKLEMSENTAAELELLKEMADELNEQEEKSKESDQPRRSSRKKNIDVTEVKDDSDRDSPVRRSSRRQKPEDENKEKNEKRDKSSPEKGKTDSKRSGKKKDDVSDDQETRSKRKSENKSKAMDDSDDQTEDESGKNDEKEGKDKKKKLSKKQVSSDITDENTDEEVEKMEEEPETKSNSKSNKKSSEKQKSKSKDRSKNLEESTEEEVEKMEEESDTKSNSKSNKKSSEKQKSKSKDRSKNLEESTEEEVEKMEEESDTKSSAKSNKKSSEKQKSKSKDRSKNLEESTEEEVEKMEEEEPETKSNAKSNKKSSEKQKSKSKDRSKNSEESTEEVEDKKIKKSEEENKKDSKKSVKKEKSEDYDKALEDQVATDMSDTTESSDESMEEFGKRKKKRKVAAKEEKETSKRQTRRSDRGKKSENNTENSDTDPNFDSDLEKEIKSLSRSTRLKKKEKESKESEKEEKSKKEKSKEKERKGKKPVKDDIGDASSGTEDDPDSKPSKRTRQSCDKKSENNTENSDTDPNFDSDLEKDIKSLSRETRLSRSKAKETKESKESKKEESKGKEEKSKEKGGKKEKKTVEEDSDLSSGEEEIPEDDDDSDEETENNLSASQLKKLKQARKAMIDEESEDDDRPDDLSSDSSDDPEISFPKLSSPKKGKKKDLSDASDDSDFVTPKKKRKRGVIKDKLLDVNISDSGSDTGKKGKGRKGKRKRKKEDDSDAFSELSDEEENRKKEKKRRRIKKIASSDEEAIGSNEEGSDMDEDGSPSKHGRKQIRKVIGSKKLTGETRKAQKAEEERRKRIAERQKEYNTYVEVEGGEEEEEEVPEGTEREMTTPEKAADSIAKILGSPRKVPVTTKCVLEMDKEKKKILIEVDRTLIRKLKPHQVEAVRFMYNCCVESVARLKKEKGAGCILAHCMGLGKTLSVITFVHTMLSNVKLTKMTKCLVVCPLNTTLNWVNEFEIWLSDVDFEIEVYEMSRVKQNFERAQMLKEWHEGGAGVMILGYDMYRNLVNGSHCKNKKQKKIFYETLAEPGPDLIVCDEGHILKNDATSLSKAMTKIDSRRRIVLTGTPLQNNLGEYHCMVDFVKPSLLGTRKEFNNRFCNPITNGQCSDSTPFDVKLMKHRAHILHELLAGCVQRKDYSALTKYLPPKFEYVISVRLSEVQMTLYENYLSMNSLGGTGDIKSKGARLFTDYQALMRIWTHPWVLKLDEIRQENKRQFDDEDDDSFIQDSGSDEDSFVDDSTTSEDNSSGDESTNDKKKKKRKTRGDKGSSSSDEDSKKENPDEVVKKWTSKRRGNEEGAGSSWMEDMGYSTGPKEVTSEWWAEFVKEEDEFRLELSGKMTLMFEILKMCEDIGDKVLVFSQSLLSLDIIEDFLTKIDEANNPVNDTTDANKPSTSGESSTEVPKENGAEKTQEEKNKERFAQYGKSWSKGLDYFRMDGSTNSQHRKASQDMFNDPENYRARLFLISTKAGSLGINLVSANRVIIFDASWNPSHDIQSIFRVYRFGQVKPVYVYRFLAQGTMEEKIYERQVTKQSLSQRVVDEHQIERHFTSNDLQELYKFQPDRLNDPSKKDRPLPILPKDHMLAELMTNNKEWIVTYHEHDSLLENVVSQELTEDEKKAAWEDYEDEKKGINKAMGSAHLNPALFATQQMNMQNLLMQGQANLGQAAVLQIVQDLKARFPNLPPEVFQQRVQAVLRQVLTQQIMQQSELQRRQLEQQRMNELNRLNQIKQQIQRQQAMINNQQRVYGMGANPGLGPNLGMQSLMTQALRPQTLSQLQIRASGMNTNLNTNLNNDQQKK